jgi:hypothetical protein
MYMFTIVTGYIHSVQEMYRNSILYGRMFVIELLLLFLQN